MFILLGVIVIGLCFSYSRLTYFTWVHGLYVTKFMASMLLSSVTVHVNILHFSIMWLCARRDFISVHYTQYRNQLINQNKYKQNIRIMTYK